MRVYYDLHIHSALSPCAENDMSPNNIVNMAVLKDLDVITVSDHNCAANVVAVEKAARRAGILFLPSIEITTAEEVHMLVFFDVAQKAEAFGEEMYRALPAIKNNPDYFGNQYIIDDNDEIIGEKEKLLISALPYSIDECFHVAKEFDGCVVPAHVNKDANSILANLGFFPPQLVFSTIEVVRGLPVMADVSGFEQLHSSDAHNLWQIAEKENFLDIEEASIAEMIKKIC